MAAVNDVNGRWTIGAASSIRIKENFRFMAKVLCGGIDYYIL